MRIGNVNWWAVILTALFLAAAGSLVLLIIAEVSVS